MLSTELVASSSNNMLLCFNKLLAIESRCFSPPDKITPPECSLYPKCS